MPSIFSSVELAPRDPILGLTETFNSDSRPGKVNLGVGVYYSEQGRIPLLDCVSAAERDLLRAASARGYMPIEGPSAYALQVQRLLFGADSETIASGRCVTAEALGGTGALRIGEDLIKRLRPDATVMISEPSWENHLALFEAAGFRVHSYPYYDPSTHGLDFPRMLAALERAEPGTVVVLHACCHNPTGVDPDPAQWRQIVECVRQRNLVPFLDIASQGCAAVRIRRSGAIAPGRDRRRSGCGSRRAGPRRCPVRPVPARPACVGNPAREWTDRSTGSCGPGSRLPRTGRGDFPSSAR